MSTDYCFTRNVSRDEFNKAVKSAGLTISINENSTEDKICVTDGNCYIWVYMFNDRVSSMTRYGGNYNGETTIIYPLACALNCSYLSEYDDDYWEDDDGGAA